MRNAIRRNAWFLVLTATVATLSLLVVPATTPSSPYLSVLSISSAMADDFQPMICPNSACGAHLLCISHTGTFCKKSGGVCVGTGNC